MWSLRIPVRSSSTFCVLYFSSDVFIQISKALLDEQQRLKVLQFLPGQESKPVTRDDVMTRLDELHSVLDNLSQDMGVPASEPVDKTEAAKNNGMASEAPNSPSKESTASSPDA